MRWKIYYSDDEVVTSEQATPFSLLRRADVQIIVQDSKDHNWVTRSGHDFYVWDERGGGAKWFNATYSGLMQYLMKPGSKCVLFGYEIDKEKFREIFDRAREEMGVKESFETDERHP